MLLPLSCVLRSPVRKYRHRREAVGIMATKMEVASSADLEVLKSELPQEKQK